jgi:hypothetical protein
MRRRRRGYLRDASLRSREPNSRDTDIHASLSLNDFARIVAKIAGFSTCLADGGPVSGINFAVHAERCDCFTQVHRFL